MTYPRQDITTMLWSAKNYWSPYAELGSNYHLRDDIILEIDVECGG